MGQSLESCHCSIADEVVERFQQIQGIHTLERPAMLLSLYSCTVAEQDDPSQTVEVSKSQFSGPRTMGSSRTCITSFDQSLGAPANQSADSCVNSDAADSQSTSSGSMCESCDESSTPPRSSGSIFEESFVGTASATASVYASPTSVLSAKQLVTDIRNTLSLPIEAASEYMHPPINEHGWDEVDTMRELYHDLECSTSVEEQLTFRDMGMFYIGDDVETRSERKEDENDDELEHGIEDGVEGGTKESPQKHSDSEDESMVGNRDSAVLEVAVRSLSRSLIVRDVVSETSSLRTEEDFALELLRLKQMIAQLQADSEAEELFWCNQLGFSEEGIHEG